MTQARDNIFLEPYVATAKKLQSGDQLSEDTMARFHGTTGLLLADIYKDLWSQEELRGFMRGMIDEHQAACMLRSPTLAAPTTVSVTRPGGLQAQLAGALIDNLRVILICATVIVVAAIIWQQLPALGQMIERQKISTTK